jgi:V/A-type H+-transporting ATPase subunit D
MEEALLYPARSLRVDMGVRSVLSVRVPTLTIGGEDEGTTLSYGLAETTAQLDGAIEGLAALLPKLIRLAEVEKTCELLADEIEKTRRRVNALEYVMIPQFVETIRFIAMKLDENERGSLTRLMKVKAMIQERAENG